jgi:two-component system cell cycle sensor histidine kinase/response regulator CckA
MKVLHIEDSIEDAELVRDLLTTEWPDCVVDIVANRPDLCARLDENAYDLILSDFSLGSFTGLDALKIVRERKPTTPFIFLSGTIGEDRAIEAVRAGAQDYVIKDRMKRLVTAIHRSLRDSLENRQREDAERRIREQADLLNKAHDAIIVTDLEGFITFWNKGAERISGFSAAEVIGLRPENVLGAAVHAELEKSWEALEKTDEWRGELHMQDRSGKEIVIEVSATLVRDDEGKPRARLSIGTDVTAKKSLEEQFYRSQRLESIGMLASGIAHDHNNVLTPIILAAPMLREHVSNPRDVRMITTLEKSAEQGAALIRQILSFAHGVSGPNQLVQIKHTIRDTKAVIDEIFPKNIRIEDHVSGDLWPIMANPTQIHQVFLNLCVNARDAMPSGGSLILRAENCVIDAAGAERIAGAKPGSWVVLHVEDTGTGIPPEALAHIWEPFFTTKAVGKGTGLGLSTVRGIVENHRGFITLDTQMGRGTTFRVYLPAESKAKSDDHNSAHPVIIRGNGELILIVDDEPQIRDVTAATLAHYGYRVLIAKDGVDALTLFSARSDEIGLVITDLNMPNLDGAALAKVVQQLNPKVKVIAMSGLTSGAHNPQIQGVVGAFLIKPFKAEALLQAVHKLLCPAVAAGEAKDFR